MKTTTRAGAHLADSENSAESKLSAAEEWCVDTLLRQAIADPLFVVRTMFGTSIRAERVAEAVKARRVLQ